MVLMHLLLSSTQISQKNLLYWENSCFSMPLFAFHLITMHGQPHAKVSSAEQEVIQSLVVHQITTVMWSIVLNIVNIHLVEQAR